MRLSEKHVKTIRNALVDFEQSSGTPNADRSAIKLAAVVETVLELAEEEIGFDLTDGKFKPIKWNSAGQPVVEAPEEPMDDHAEPDQVEVAEPEPEQKPKRSKVDHMEIVSLSKRGMKPTEIAKQLGVGYNTVWRHLQFERDMGAK